MSTDREYMAIRASARELWLKLLRQAEKDRVYFKAGRNADYAGRWREFRSFFLWLLLNGYRPGMDFSRPDPCEAFGPKNFTLIRESAVVSLEAQQEIVEAKEANDTIVEGMTVAQIASKYDIAVSILLQRYYNGARTVNALRLIDTGVEKKIPKRPSVSRKQKLNPDGTVCTISDEANKRLTSIYDGVRDRCKRPSDDGYPRYGGRGIKICEEWDGHFPVFRQWAMRHGYAVGLTIERIDPNGDYCPENCRWATWAEQTCSKCKSMYRVLRLHAGEARGWLTGYPGHNFVTIIVRNDITPPGFSEPAPRGPLCSTLRLHAGDACEWLAKYPGRGIVTIIVRKDLMPPNPPEQCDYET